MKRKLFLLLDHDFLGTFQCLLWVHFPEERHYHGHYSLVMAQRIEIGVHRRSNTQYLKLLQKCEWTLLKRLLLEITVNQHSWFNGSPKLDYKVKKKSEKLNLRWPLVPVWFSIFVLFKIANIAKAHGCSGVTIWLFCTLFLYYP